MGMIGNSLAQGLISGANIQDGTVDTPDIKDGAVHTAKVADDAVHTAKIADGAVTSDKLASGVAIPATGGTFSGDVDFSGDVNLTGNLSFNNPAQIHGDGTQANPFRGLGGASAYAQQTALPDGDYYVKFDGTSYLRPFIFNNDMVNTAYYNRIGPRAWMKVTSGFGTLTSLTSGAGRQIPSNANVAINSSGVITMDYIENLGCGTAYLTYGINLPSGCDYRFAQMNIYRPHSLHQCLNIFDTFNSDLSRATGDKAAKLVALFGAATVSEFYSGGTKTQASIDPNASSGGGGPAVSMCSWSSSIHAEYDGGGASTTNYDYQALCCLFQTPTPFGKIGFHLNCAGESTISQTNTTHEYWIAA